LVEVVAVLTPRELAAIIKKGILNRAGEVITEAVAAERANNIAAGLAGHGITEG
jgi:hypothetical protein